MSGVDEIEDPVAVLQRWQDAGAIWRVVGRSPSGLQIALLTCTGGEEVDRLSSSDPSLLEFVGSRNASDE